MDRDPFDFDEDETEVERPEAGEDDPALLGPVLEALKTVRDPEIPMDLVELGLIYELIVKRGGTVYVEMTLTTPHCPVAASMPGEVENAIRAVPGVEDVRGSRSRPRPACWRRPGRQGWSASSRHRPFRPS